jgi:hypothetical protein
MDDRQEHSLVVKALQDGLSNCVFWDGKSNIRVRNGGGLHGITPSEIRQRLIEFVRRRGGGVVEQITECREYWRDRYRFYYKVIVPMSGFTHGIFVEMRLTGQDDPEFPEVTIVNAHPQLD